MPQSQNPFEQLAAEANNPSQPAAQPASPAASATSTPTSNPQTTPQGPSGNPFEQLAAADQKQNGTPNGGTTAQQAANDANSEAAKELARKQGVAKHSILARAWDWVNQPIFDNVLPQGIKTSDIIRAAAFEKMYNEAYIPGVNDFDSKARDHFEAPAKAVVGTKDGHPYVAAPESHAVKNAIRTFIAGVGKDTSDMAAGFTSPVGIATTLAGVGPEAKAGTALAKVAPVAKVLAGTAFAGQGAYHAVRGTLGESGMIHGVTPENVQETLGGTGQALLGAAGGLEAAKGYVAPRLQPKTVNVAGEEIPVTNDSWLAKASKQIADRDDLQRMNVHSTQPAVRAALGNKAEQIASKNLATLKPDVEPETFLHESGNPDSLVKHVDPDTGKVVGDGRIRTFNDAADTLEAAGRTTFKKLDALGKDDQGFNFSDYQRAEKSAWSRGDMDAVAEARKGQQELMDKSEIDTDELGSAKALWARAQAMREFQGKLLKDTVATPTKFSELKTGELDNGYIKPQALADDILRFRKSGRMADMGVDHADEADFQHLSDILRDNEVAGDRLNNIIRWLSRKGVDTFVGGTLGTLKGGPVGGFIGAASGFGTEYAASRVLTNILTNTDGLKALNAGLRQEFPVEVTGNRILEALKTTQRATASQQSRWMTRATANAILHSENDEQQGEQEDSISPEKQ